MAQVQSFRFTPAGGQQREQQVHRADIAFQQDDQGRQRLSMWIDTTRPGETRDDRGAEGWDSGVIVAFMTVPLQLPTGNTQLVLPDAVPSDSWGERFLYYWDHADFPSASMTIMRRNGAWDITFAGTCAAGNAVAFDASFDG